MAVIQRRWVNRFLWNKISNGESLVLNFLYRLFPAKDIYTHLPFVVRNKYEEYSLFCNLFDQYDFLLISNWVWYIEHFLKKVIFLRITFTFSNIACFGSVDFPHICFRAMNTQYYLHEIPTDCLFILLNRRTQHPEKNVLIFCNLMLFGSGYNIYIKSFISRYAAEPNNTYEEWWLVRIILLIIRIWEFLQYLLVIQLC